MHWLEVRRDRDGGDAMNLQERRTGVHDVIFIEVDGRAAPQGSKKFVGMRTRKGDTSGKQHGVLVEMSKGVKPWRHAVHTAGLAVQTPDWSPMDGPLELTILFFMLRPLSHPKTRHTYPITAPDLSKLVRSTEDALTTARVWADDARVVDMHVVERYAIPRQLTRLYVEGVGREHPGALIRVRRIAEAAA